MTLNVSDLLSKVEPILDSETAAKASALMLGRDTRLVDGAPTEEAARELSKTLRTRLEISKRTGKKMFGLEPLLKELAKMNASATVRGYGFISPQAAGNVYIQNDGDRGLGVVLVDR
ncbi:hypothetical protein [Roseateles chitinivorans]|uniref:hypothetical protein n=1 Tax=Roseateles chitinivorans TaxID=2917965 RepID=UPI003D671FDC